MTDRQSTHADDCWGWGPKHYDCAVREIKALRAELETLKSSASNPPQDFSDAYQGAMEDLRSWKKRALEAEELNRKFIAEVNGPTHMGEPIPSAPAVPDGLTPRHWRLIDFALWRLINDAYSKANFAAQEKDRLHWKPEHVGKFLQDAEDAGAARRIVMKAIADNGWTAAHSPTEKKESPHD